MQVRAEITDLRANALEYPNVHSLLDSSTVLAPKNQKISTTSPVFHMARIIGRKFQTESANP